jgi:hypothetical protein
MTTTKVYFGFALSSSMFGDFEGSIERHVLELEDVKAAFNEFEIESCLNPSHLPTIKVMQAYGIPAVIPEKPPTVSLNKGDTLLVMGVSGLPRLTDRHEYDAAEIEKAIFTFSSYTLI